MTPRLTRLLSLEWDSIAGLVAAFLALVLNTLGVIGEDVVKPILLLLLALLFMRDLRRETKYERTTELIQGTASDVKDIQLALRSPDVILFGPRQLRAENERFNRAAFGHMVLFNVCLLMYRPQHLFDTLLRPAIENPHVTSILFILDEGERDVWHSAIAPMIAACNGSSKVSEPHWCKIHESISFVLADTGPHGGAEALLSFWGEPFMAKTTTRDVPRYVFLVRAQSELIASFVEMERNHRLHGESRKNPLSE